MPANHRHIKIQVYQEENHMYIMRISEENHRYIRRKITGISQACLNIHVKKRPIIGRKLQIYFRSDVIYGITGHFIENIYICNRPVEYKNPPHILNMPKISIMMSTKLSINELCHIRF